MAIKAKDIRLIREKDGIALFTVRAEEDKYYVLKYFKNEAFLREILHYSQLATIGVPTIPVVATTAKSLLMEDLNFSSEWRLGVKEDMDSPIIAKALAEWYLQLHNKGQALANDQTLNWYSELDSFNPEGIALVKKRTASQDAAIWKRIEDKTDLINRLIKQTNKTLTFNDFYYVNLAVSRDEKRALIFDYNLLGVGYPAMDVANVCASLSPRAGEAFRQAYGPVDPTEVALIDVLAPITTLVTGDQRENLPTWFDEAWRERNHPDFLNKLEGLEAL